MLYDVFDDKQNSNNRLRTSPHANQNPDVFNEWTHKSIHEKIKIQNQIQHILDKESNNSYSAQNNSFMDSPLKEIKEEGKETLPKLKIKCVTRDEQLRPRQHQQSATNDRIPKLKTSQQQQIQNNYPININIRNSDYDNKVHFADT